MYFVHVVSVGENYLEIIWKTYRKGFCFVSYK